MRKSEKFFYLLFLIIKFCFALCSGCVFVAAFRLCIRLVHNLSRFMKWRKKEKKINKKISTQALFRSHRMKSSMRYFESSEEKCK